MAFDINMIKEVYDRVVERVDTARKITGKPLTLAEKILYAHLWDGHPTKAFARGEDYVDFAPDRIACQDATAQMALLQFMQAGKPKVAVPTTVHCDHLIQARVGATKDLQAALNNSNEVFNFLESVSNKYGIGFWKLEQYYSSGSPRKLCISWRNDDRNRFSYRQRWRIGNGSHWCRRC